MNLTSFKRTDKDVGDGPAVVNLLHSKRYK
jgi:hypothetical protein